MLTWQGLVKATCQIAAWKVINRRRLALHVCVDGKSLIIQNGTVVEPPGAWNNLSTAHWFDNLYSSDELILKSVINCRTWPIYHLPCYQSANMSVWLSACLPLVDSFSRPANWIWSNLWLEFITATIIHKTHYYHFSSRVERIPQGPSIKYVTLEGEGVREGVTVCDRGGGSRACDITLIQIVIIHMKHEI